MARGPCRNDVASHKNHTDCHRRQASVVALIWERMAGEQSGSFPTVLLPTRPRWSYFRAWASWRGDEVREAYVRKGFFIRGGLPVEWALDATVFTTASEEIAGELSHLQTDFLTLHSQAPQSFVP